MPLAPGTPANAWIGLKVVAPPEKVFISPWDSLVRACRQAPVRRGDNRAAGEAGARAILESGQALAP
ncbi:MAG: hypothetical protein ACR2I2_17905 [Bryobacteraceae bacterium]